MPPKSVAGPDTSVEQLTIASAAMHTTAKETRKFATEPRAKSTFVM
jgi:hypothetical protein